MLLCSLVALHPVSATENYDWSRPRPSHYRPFNETIAKASFDSNAAVTLGVNIAEYIESVTGTDFLRLNMSMSANSREWIDYDWGWPLHGYSWCEATTQTNITGDNSGTWLELGFTLLFYGVEYHKIWVCSNGFLCLNGTSTSLSPQTIPDSQEPNSIIPVFWRDLHPENGGSITYEENVYFEGGSYFVVSWNNVPDASGNPQTFQVLIEHRTGWDSDNFHNSIYFQYKSITKNCVTTIGIEDQLGRRGESFPLNDIYNGLCRSLYVSIEGYRLQQISLKLMKNDTNAQINFLRTMIGGYNVILQNPNNPYGILWAIPIGIAADCLIGLCTGGALTAIMFGALVVTGETAAELAANLSPPIYEIKDAFPQDNEAHITSECVIENRSIDYCKPFDSTLAAVVEWDLSDPNTLDHSLTVIAEATYVNIFDDSVQTITTSTTLNMRTARYVNIEARKTDGSAISNVNIWVDGVRYRSPVYITLTRGTHIVQAEPYFYRRVYWLYTFEYWEDGSTNNTRIISAEDDMNLTAYYCECYCPTLFVWNGSEFVYETLLNIHAETDITVQHQIQQTLVLDGIFYKLQLRELDNFTSHIDQVKLYAVDQNGEWHTCPLTIAKLNGTYVTLKLLFDDDRRVDLYPSQIIDLKFLPSIPYHETPYFIFEINGHNRKLP
jgi:hypothetical protein